MPALVRQNVGSAAPALNATATITATTAGNLIVAFVARSGGSATGALTSVSDSATQTWTRATRGAASGVTNTRLEVWYIENSQAITSVTFNSGTSQFYTWNILEFSGIAASNSLSGASPDYSNSGASVTTVTCPSLTIDVGDVIIGGFSCGQVTVNSAPTSPWTDLTAYGYSGSSTARACYQVSPAPATYTPGDWVIASGHNSGLCTVAFTSGVQNVEITFPPEYDLPPAGATSIGTPTVVVTVDSPALEVAGFGTFSGVKSTDDIISVTVDINMFASDAGMGAPTYELWNGTANKIGETLTGTTSTEAVHHDAATVTGIGYAQLSDLRVRIYAHRGTAPSAAVQYVDYVTLIVDYIPSPDVDIAAAAVLGTGTGVEIITNTSFETDLTGWTAQGIPPVTIEQSAAQAHSGTKSMLITSAGPSFWSEAAHYLTGTIPGQQYVYSGYIYMPNGNGPLPSVASSGGFGGGATCYDTWQQIEGFFTANTIDQEFMVFLSWASEAGKIFYADDASCRPTPTYIPFPPYVGSSVAISPTVVPGSTSVPTPPTISAGSTVSATKVPGTISVPVPTVKSDASVTTTRVPGTITVPTPTVKSDVAITVTKVPGTITISTPGVRGDVSITTTRVPGTITVPTPGVKSDVSITTTTVPGTVTIVSPTVRQDQSITAVVINSKTVIYLSKLGVLAGPNYSGSSSGDWVNPSYATGTNNDQYATWTVA